MKAQVIIALSTVDRTADEVERLVAEGRRLWPDGDVVVMSVDEYAATRDERAAAIASAVRS